MREYKASFIGAALALALGGAVLPAQAADVTVAVGPPGIAFGYSDGYWDRTHNWHQWRDAQEAARWREQNREHYYARRHDAERDLGWREADRYWERH